MKSMELLFSEKFKEDYTSVVVERVECMMYFDHDTQENRYTTVTCKRASTSLLTCLMIKNQKFRSQRNTYKPMNKLITACYEFGK